MIVSSTSFLFLLLLAVFLLCSLWIRINGISTSFVSSLGDTHITRKHRKKSAFGYWIVVLYCSEGLRSCDIDQFFIFQKNIWEYFEYNYSEIFLQWALCDAHIHLMISFILLVFLNSHCVFFLLFFVNLFPNFLNVSMMIVIPWKLLSIIIFFQHWNSLKVLLSILHLENELFKFQGGWAWLMKCYNRYSAFDCFSVTGSDWSKNRVVLLLTEKNKFY